MPSATEIPIPTGNGLPSLESECAGLPEYARTQAAFHRAFVPELRRAVRSLPIPPSAQVLDCPCGDGFYTLLLADRLDASGSLTAVDLSPEYLAKARERMEGCDSPVARESVEGDAYRLPFADASFDLVWCAESLITLDRPMEALAEFRRVVRPGGLVAILETDEMHRVIINWSVELELALNRAVVASAKVQHGPAWSVSPSRRVGRWLRKAGLTTLRRRTFAADRASGFSPTTAEFLKIHLADLRKTVAPHLSAADLGAFDEMCDTENPTSIYRRTDAEVLSLFKLFVARKPSEAEAGSE